MSLINQREDCAPFAFGNLHAAAQPLCTASNRGLPSQIHRLSMNDIAEMTLQRSTLLYCS